MTFVYFWIGLGLILSHRFLLRGFVDHGSHSLHIVDLVLGIGFMTMMYGIYNLVTG